jgi:hypothetical protein
MGSEEVGLIGLTCNLIGIFFLANSVLFRRPRKVMEEFFSLRKGSLDTINDYVLNKIQVVIGFMFLTVGFVLQGMRSWGVSEQKTQALAICLGLLLFAGLLYAVGSLYSRLTFKRYLVDFFRHHGELLFKDNMANAKEIGRVFGINPAAEESVQDYGRKLRLALKIDTAPKGVPVSDRTRRLREMAPMPPDPVAMDRP